jgi:hypothetical protein
MDVDDDNNAPELVDTSVSHNKPKASDNPGAELEERRVPLTLVTGMLQRLNP